MKTANNGIDNWFHLANYQAENEIYTELRLLGRQYQNYIEGLELEKVITGIFPINQAADAFRAKCKEPHVKVMLKVDDTLE